MMIVARDAERPCTPVYMPWVFALTMALSAGLIMLVQPLCARFVLPYLGGTPNVWNACMLFFQTGLLLGYGYAHLASRWLGAEGTVWVQCGLLLIAMVLLPINLPRPDAPPEFPLLWLLASLVAAVALPYVVMSATGPLLQHWFARAANANPYALFAASNLGSFAGLLAYPLVIEPTLTLGEQSAWWRGGYVLLGLLTLFSGMQACAAKGRTAAPLPASSEPAPTWPKRLHWLALALVPSSLLLSVTNYLTTDIAAIPLLWVLPLALYLLTFTLVFANRPIVSYSLLVRFQPLAILALMLLLLREATEPLVLVLGLYLASFFWLALVCHGELARTKPATTHLTEFYFWLALGGALGGAFNALLAPILFSGYAEFPLMIALAALLRPRQQASSYSWLDLVAPVAVGLAAVGLILVSKSLALDATWSIAVVYMAPLVACYALHGRPWSYGGAVAAVFLASLLDPGVHGAAALRARSFFGVHRVTEQNGMRRLVHGNTVHGQQFLDPAKRGDPLTYYHRTGPIGTLLTALAKDKRLNRVGIVGLGTGSLAAYADAGQRWTFFEIDPAVVQIARDSKLFTFLAGSRGDIDVEVGDARITLRQVEERFGVLVIDAFSSDAIPWHLLTREALELYRSRLCDDGVVAFHISNRYVDLEPILAQHADDVRWPCRIFDDTDSRASTLHPGKEASIWLFMARPGALPSMPTRAARMDPGLRPWTDDYANLLSVLKWRRE